MGTLLRDRYELLEVVGRGGQGEVVRALDRFHDRQVALKLRRVRTAEDRSSALSEGRVLLNLHTHPQLPVVREDFFVDDIYCIVMDWVEGTTLAQRATRAGGRLPLPEVLEHLAEVATALDHLHAHDPPVVHGDVKPDNILLTATGTTLVDFGLARQGAGSGVLAGTRGFAAPELARGTPLTPAADIFSLAATAFALLTGEPPRPGVLPAWRAIAGDRARSVELALRRALSLDPSNRPGRASALVRAMATDSGPPTNLPMEVSSFVGRQRLLREVVATLGDDRLVSLVGPGGIGKSRLARQAAGDVLEEVPDGAWLVELAPLTDPDELANRVLAILGVTLEPSAVPEKALVAHLAERRLLLVLDNCEHLRDDVAHFAARLVAGCPHVRLLMTSRQALGVEGERVITVPPLDLPPRDGDASLDVLSRSEAVRLLVERAARARPDFAVEQDEAPVLAELCRRLDGIPLALELAAARLATDSVAQVVQGLDDRFRLLAAVRRPGLARHETLRSAVEWSYDALPVAERRVFDRLSVFAGGCEPTAAEEVASGAWVDAGDVTPTMAGLVDKSLLVREETDRGPRYRMLETLREFSAERLRAAGDHRRVHARHLRWARTVVAEAGTHAHRADAAPWLSLLDTELDNIREALRWGLVNDPEGAMRLLVRLGWYWASRNRQTEGRKWWEAVLAANPDGPLELRASGLIQVGTLADHQSDHDAARASFERALEAYTELGDSMGVGRSLSHLGYSSLVTGNRFAAARFLDEAIATLRPLGPSEHLALALARRGRLLVGQDRDAARAYYEEAVTMFAALGHEFGRAQSVLNLGLIVLHEGDLDRAEALIAEVLGPHYEGLQFGKIRMAALCALAHVASERGDLSRARQLYESVLTEASDAGLAAEIGFACQGLAGVALKQGDVPTARRLLERAFAAGARPVPSWYEDLAAVAVAEGDHRQAATLLGQAAALRDVIGEPVPPLSRRVVDATTASTRAALGRLAFDEAWNRGLRMAARDKEPSVQHDREKAAARTRRRQRLPFG